jgi:uncharacterized lipoprotein YddW (UPF0748 family)
MKRIIAAIAALLMLVPLFISPTSAANENETFYSVSTRFHGINIERAADSLVLYTHLGQQTKTNEWGYEIVCTGGFVSAVGGNNNRVPSEEGSLVASAHGECVTWLQENVKIGMRVSYDINTQMVTFTYDEEAALQGMHIQVDALWEAYNNAITKFDNFDYKATKTAIENLEADIDKTKAAYEETGDSAVLANAASGFGEKADQIAVLISESPTVEYRGAWVRATQTTALQVDNYVQTLYENGLNLLCVETLVDSTMIMPMPEDSLFEHDPALNGFDLLQAYIDACHKRGMELHIWLPVFYVGDGGSANVSRSVGIKKPEWRSKSSNGNVTDTGGYVMLDPANPEVQDFLIETYRYILETYDIDGFQLDYIRYFERTATYDMGYNEGAMREFFAKYAERPRYDTTWKKWDEWVQFRCDKITDFVRKVRNLIDEVNPDVLLGADVVPDPTDSKAKNYQDYFKWLDEGLLDIVFPMAYGYGWEDAIKKQVASCGSNAFIAVGLGIFMDEMTPVIMDEQANFNTAAAADGSVYFSSYWFLRKNTGTILLNGVYRNKAITPTFDIKQASLEKIKYAKDRINNIILPLEGITQEGADQVIKALDELAASIESGYQLGEQKYYFDPLKYYNVKKAIDDADPTANAWVRMNDDLTSIVKAYSVQSKAGDEVILRILTEEQEVEEFIVEVEVEAQKANESNAQETTGDDSKKNIIPIIIIVGCIAIGVLAVVVAVIVATSGPKKSKNEIAEEVAPQEEKNENKPENEEQE